MAGERLQKALKEYRRRYQKASQSEKSSVLDEFCRLSKYHRKYAIVLLNKPADAPAKDEKRRRGVTYSPAALRVIEAIWKAAGYPWSERLTAMLPLWLPWARPNFRELTEDVEREVLSITPRQIDRRLKAKKLQMKRRIYGRTKPGTLLKHHIPLKTDSWDVTEPGFTEVDLVSHSGDNASGEFVHSLNVTDIHTGWTETRAIVGKGEAGVVDALDTIRRALPFPLRGIDSDNGSEFINHHLYRYCQKHRIQFTRGRPYKKDDNAHIEQKNWTHVRQIFGWDRYDTPQVARAMNELYTGDLRLMMNLYQASVKLREKERVGSKLRRRYHPAETPLDRLVAETERHQLCPSQRKLLDLREKLNPFKLSDIIESKLRAIEHIRKDPASCQQITSIEQPHPSPRGGVTKEEIYAYF
jgi:transposase InsO family protein